MGSPQYHPAAEVSSYRKSSCSEKTNPAVERERERERERNRERERERDTERKTETETETERQREGRAHVCVFQTVELSFKLYLEAKFC